MSKPLKHPLLPFTYEAVDPIDTAQVHYYGVVMVDHFGDLKKGEGIMSLSVDYHTGEIEVWLNAEQYEDNPDPEPLKTVHFAVVPQKGAK